MGVYAVYRPNDVICFTESTVLTAVYKYRACIHVHVENKATCKNLYMHSKVKNGLNPLWRNSQLDSKDICPFVID